MGKFFTLFRKEVHLAERLQKKATVRAIAPLDNKKTWIRTHD
jgi:hypothetical protein